MADRFCGQCGNELSDDDRFCRNCGTPVHEAAQVPTPEADVPTPPPPPQSGWQRFREGWQGTGQEGTRFSDPAPPPLQSDYQQRGPGVWSGVKLGCGMFIVLPIILFLLGIVVLAIIGIIGSAGG